MHCVNIKHSEVAELSQQLRLPKVVIAAKIALWQEANTMDRFPTAEEITKPAEVNFTLKTTDIISKNLDRITKLFKQLKDTNNFWTKIQKDFQIPKDQLELLKNSEGNTIEEKLLDFVAKYSYTVEINTAKAKQGREKFDNIQMRAAERGEDYFAERDFYDEIEGIEREEIPTQHYSNLTVPGGTNYTENEIAIPGVEVEEKPQGITPKQGVEELFNSNPELANSVYEALGFNFRYTSEKWKDDPTIENKATYINIKGTPSNQEFQIKKDIEDGFYSVHFKTEQGKLTKEQIQTLVDAIASQIPIGGKLSTWGNITKGGISGLNRFLNNGFKKVGEREIKDREGNPIVIPILEKVEKSNLEQQALQLYSQYLDTIFPDSKVKDIVYRGKTENQTNQKSKELGIFFTDDKNAANIYAVKYKGDEFDDSIIQGIVNKYGLNPTIEQIKSEIAFFEKMGATKEQIEKDAKEFQKYILNNKGVSEQAILNIKNPKNLTVKDWFDNYENSSKLKENSDGLLLKGGKQSNNRVYDAGENQFVVFEPEQIHILGSKQDIEGFKFWIKSNTKKVRKGAITPSIKGHAQFATDNGIGWFRSDDKTIDNVYNIPDSDKQFVTRVNDDLRQTTKTRRILEVQSDLFQKGRDRKNLAQDKWISWGKNPDTGKDMVISKEDTNSNQFLQLLNKDNNWVTFFVKSIIQDSAKKGYEKVLFPRLNTIIQIESQNRFKTYEEASDYYNKSTNWIQKEKELNEEIDDIIKDIEVIKKSDKNEYTYGDKILTKQQELERQNKYLLQAKEERASNRPTLLNTANFYENELANRLDDIVGGNKNNRAKGIWALNQITDEYGNTWNEVKIISEHSEPILAAVNKLEYKFKELIKLNKSQISDLNKAMILARVKEANAKLGTSYYIHFNQIGESDNYTWIIEDKSSKQEQLDLFDNTLEDSTQDYIPDTQEYTEESIGQITEDTEEKFEPLFLNKKLNDYFTDSKELKTSNFLRRLFPNIDKDKSFLASLANQLLKVLHNDVTIKVMSRTEFNDYSEKNKLKFSDATKGLIINGIYNHNLNEIVLVDSENLNVEIVGLHEILHALSYKYLREDNQLAKDFKELYKKAKSLMTEKEKNDYSVSNEDEFFAHLSDPNFIKMLASKKSVNSEGLTIWQKLKQILANALKSLGIEIKGTFLEDYFSLVNRILEDANDIEKTLKELDEKYVADYSKFEDEVLVGSAENKEINVQDSNLKSLEKNNKTISVRKVGEHNYVKGDILTVKVNGKDTEIKVRVTDIITIDDFSKLSDKDKDEFAKSIGNYVNFDDFKRSDEYANESSPQSMKFPHIYRFINGKEPADIIKYSVIEKSIVDQESPYKKIQIFLTRKIKRLEKELKHTPQNTFDADQKAKEINDFKEKLAKLVGSKDDKDVYKELGEEFLTSVETLLNMFESGTVPTAKDLTHIKEIIDAWKDFASLHERVSDIADRYRIFVSDYVLKTVNEHSTAKEPITKDKLDADTKDIGTITMGTGALADSINIIARTIGSIIKIAQNFVATTNKKLAASIQTEIDALYEYAKKNGVTLDEVYSIFIQEHKGTTILTKPSFENQEPNPNYEKIQSTPELKKFYDFYQETIEDLEKKVPTSFGKYFIPNMSKNKSLLEEVKSLNPIKHRRVGFSFDQENLADILETKYDAILPAANKESNLGEVLLKFGMYANNYEKMSSVLPELRLLQEQLEYKINSKGQTIERRFINPSSPSSSVSGKASKIWKQVDETINMQVKGNMKNEKQARPKIKTTNYDKEGNPIEESYVDITGVADNLLKYNSLLRIGLSPITAVSNILFGDASNLIEAFGGRFFGVKDLVNASNIFIKQNLNKDSELNKLLLELNPLQELDDYHYQEKVKLTGKTIKMSKEKALEYVYSMQKSGEKWLQSRTMIAVLIHDGYMNSKGELLDKYNNASEAEKTQLTDKIQRLNQQIHGRYTTKEAAIWQQGVMYRLFSQFRKWMVSGYETRLGVYNEHDNRLQVDTEGRYITIGRMIGDLKNTIDRIKEGKLTDLEKYNARKTIAEIVMLTATVLIYSGLRGGDDDKKRRKNPLIKTSLTLLNRTAGDLEYFYSPINAVKLGENALPVAKTLDDLYKVVKNLPAAAYLGDWEITRGSNKHNNKFYHQLGKQIPGIKPVKDILRLTNAEELEELK